MRMNSEQTESEFTTVQIDRGLHTRLKEIRPYHSMSFNDLLTEIVDFYEGSDRS